MPGQAFRLVGCGDHPEIPILQQKLGFLTGRPTDRDARLNGAHHPGCTGSNDQDIDAAPFGVVTFTDANR